MAKRKTSRTTRDSRPEPKEVKHQESPSCGCVHCRNNQPFEVPENFYKELVNGRVVVFAGAGISTEGRNVFPYTLYQDVCDELQIDISMAPPFPDLMSKYCSQSNGRAKLLNKIRDRFEYVSSFPSLYHAATRFHVELSTFAVVENIITTNWDAYFEQECGATPFVSAEDFAFWEVPGRKVFKIHGSVNSYGSIVATREDYERCLERLTKGLLGSSLRLLLATKTIVYMGYSFSDDDFLAIHERLTAEMQGLRPDSYIVTLDKSSHERFEEKGLTPIYTDATFFLSKLKRRLVSEGLLIADDRFDGVSTLLNRVLELHAEVAKIDAGLYPDVIFTLCYQDGLIHALERMLHLKKTGYYSHRYNPLHAAKMYEDSILPEKIKQKRYHDVAYVEGYIDGLVYLLADEDTRKRMSLFYAFGVDRAIKDSCQFITALKRARQTSPKTHKFAQELVKRRLGPNLVFHHTPFLL